MNETLSDNERDEYEDTILQLKKRIKVIQHNRNEIFNQNVRTYKRNKELEAELANEKSVAAKAYTACGNYQAEIQEVSNQLINLYTECNETTEPEVYGTILGLHEGLEIFLKS